MTSYKIYLNRNRFLTTTSLISSLKITWLYASILVQVLIITPKWREPPSLSLKTFRSIATEYSAISKTRGKLKYLTKILRGYMVGYTFVMILMKTRRDYLKLDGLKIIK
jgi:hypothetical protein